MSSCASDYDPSESSKSPQSTWEAHSSPSQLVPQLTTNLTELSVDQNYRYNGIGPYLRITEQPQKYFRFRYVSEMVGTHGCLLGKSYTTNKVKTHPTVELVNYNGRALIRCQLAQDKKDDEHPHKLLDEQDRDMSHQVPEHGSYRVVFAGMGIIHTAKKEVSGWLYKKFLQQHKNERFNKKEIESQCEIEAKGIDLNIVRLKFSAHDIVTDAEICPPVFSESIYNLKCASTNDLKICRMSRCYGRPRGGEDVFIFVEKVNKKNIQVRFFQLNESGQRCWTAPAKFVLSDVHHQYAIAFGTPAYQDLKISEDVQVFIELARPSDGRTSAPMEFTYKAEQIYKHNKKRKTTSSYSSYDSSSGSGGSIKSIIDVPAPVILAETLSENNERMVDIPIQQNVVYPNVTSQCELADAFMEIDNKGSPNSFTTNPMWGTADISLHTAPSLPALKLDSTELETLANRGSHSVQMDKEFLNEYLSSINFLSENNNEEEQINGMNFVRTLQMIHSDSARAKAQPKPKEAVSKPVQSEPAKTDNAGGSGEYSAYYRQEDGVEVKKLVKELCSIIQNKATYKKQEVRNKLEKLFSYRLSNGDTFLHMTLCSNQSSFEYIVKIIHSVRMSHLLEYYNNKQQTILHMAIINDLPKIVSLLIAKGCNPMNKDSDDENAIHYAVRSDRCLEALLDAIKKNKVPCDLNDCNNEKQTPLHVSTSESSTRLLLQHGASYNVRDAQGRTPLHFAAYYDNVAVVKALLEFVSPSDIDGVDGCGNTALQIVCGGSVRKNTVEIVKLLLENKADPLKQGDNNISAWKMSREQPEIREVMKNYVTAAAYEEDTKSELDDEFESADEDEMRGGGAGLAELGAYADELSAALEARGAWETLARRAGLAPAAAWCAHQPRPARTLLFHLRECRSDISSKTLAVILEDMGELEAATIIRRHIE